MSLTRNTHLHAYMHAQWVRQREAASQRVCVVLVIASRGHRCHGRLGCTPKTQLMAVTLLVS